MVERERCMNACERVVMRELEGSVKECCKRVVSVWLKGRGV